MRDGVETSKKAGRKISRDNGSISSQKQRTLSYWAQFHKGIQNVGDSMLLNQYLSRILVRATKLSQKVHFKDPFNF